MAPRGRGGKFSKPSRGGGKHFSRDLQPLDKEGNPLGMWRDPADKKEESSSEEEDESSEEESDEEEDAPSGSAAVAAQELSREQRRELARKKKAAAIAKKNKKVAAVGDMPTDSEEESSEEDEGDLPANPNHTSKARNQARAVTGAANEAPLPRRDQKENLSRREKEAIAAQAAKERYQKLHAEGKTDEAKADLARLRLIKEQREEAAARKQAEKEEREERERENKEKLDKEDKKRADAMGNTGAKKPLKSRVEVKGKK